MAYRIRVSERDSTVNPSDEHAKKIRIARSQCPTHGLDLIHVMDQGPRETLRCPDKFCGYSVTRDR